MQKMRIKLMKDIIKNMLTQKKNTNNKLREQP